jgi:hypothetical protein
VSARFTIDGSAGLEAQLGDLCQEVLAGVQSIIPAARIAALVLGGGYGRGEGGVFKSETRERPYNDMEFYVFLRGNRVLNERKYSQALRQLGHRLSPAAEIEIEFKIDSIEHLERGTVSMFSYDLVSAHRIIFGAEDFFQGCAHHLESASIPLSEATRLLFNRCTGLLLARELLCRPDLAPDQIDFIGRNLAKAQLALGDVVLTVLQQYHWSCPERHRRLGRPAPASANLVADAPSFDRIVLHHAAGVEFKLHPTCATKSTHELEAKHAEVSSLALQLWLWLESRRLNCAFASVRDYAFHAGDKCPEPALWRNFLLNLRTFGFRAALDSRATRYPRGRLFNSLPLLLWNGAFAGEPDVTRHVQQQLHTTASDWTGLVAAYKHVWPSYG